MDMERRNHRKYLMDQKKKILVLGSKGGLGSRIISLLNQNHKSDYQIISLSRNSLQTENTTKMVHFNATDHVENQRIFEDIDENYGPIWAVIDATGLSVSGKYTKTTWETITQQIDVNLFHPLNICSYFLKSMAKNKYYLPLIAAISYLTLVVLSPKNGHEWDNYCWGLWAETI